MKKTLITLIALSGLALGDTADELNASLKRDLLASQYQFGDVYELTFKLGVTENQGGTTGALLTLATGVHFVTQIGWYSGINTADSNSGLEWPGLTSLDTESEPDRVITTVTTDTKTDNKKWFSYNQQGGSGEAKGLNGSTITLSYDGTDTTLTVDYAGAAYNHDLINKFVWQGVSFDANDIVFTTRNVNSSYVSFVPEPATASLSLLALAGLAMRRKRH